MKIITTFLRKAHSTSALALVSGSFILPAHADTLYVWQSSPAPAPPYNTWATAAHNIQDAIDVAQPSDDVLVAQGVYETGGRAVGSILTNRVAIEKPITVQSVMGPERTVIAGAPTPGGGNGDGAVRCAYLGDGAVLSGFMLTRGHTLADVLFPDNPFVEGSGGGAQMHWNAKLSNCIITGNSADFGGGGVSGGAMERCILTNNSALIGGAAVYSVVSRCILASNFAALGGGVAESDLYNCLLTGNQASLEGGGAVDSRLYNCTVSGNSAPVGGGVSAGFIVINSIVIANHAQIGPNHYAESEGLYSWSYTCTTPLIDGPGNISKAPVFANPAAGDYRLVYGSPGIDAGTDLSAFLTDDLDGRPRPLDGNGDGIAAFDMGAYEFDLRGIIPPVQALERCIKLVENSNLSRKDKQPLIATLGAAAASLERESFQAAMGQLGAFQNKVRAQIARDDPTQAEAFIKCAQAVIDAIQVLFP